MSHRYDESLCLSVNQQQLSFDSIFFDKLISLEKIKKSNWSPIIER